MEERDYTYQELIDYIAIDFPQYKKMKGEEMIVNTITCLKLRGVLKKKITS